MLLNLFIWIDLVGVPSWSVLHSRFAHTHTLCACAVLKMYIFLIWKIYFALATSKYNKIETNPVIFIVYIIIFRLEEFFVKNTLPNEAIFEYNFNQTQQIFLHYFSTCRKKYHSWFSWNSARHTLCMYHFSISQIWYVFPTRSDEQVSISGTIFGSTMCYWMRTRKHLK